MNLVRIQIQNLRNLKAVNLTLHPHVNFIIGGNGSGKTAFLEAIYLLSSGHSFRTREISPLIKFGERDLTVFTTTHDAQTISIKKSMTLTTKVQINHSFCQNNSELAYILPCQVFYQDIFQIIDAGPAVRRKVLDWGVFHCQPAYHSLWKNYRRALKHRNILLRQQAKQQQLLPWDKTLSDLSAQLDALRNEYFTELNIKFKEILTQLSPIQCSLEYYKGWDRRKVGKHLALILAENYQQDLGRQYTLYGAHQADLIIDSCHINVRQCFSRGEQKIILFALKIAQAKLISKPCVFLCDDLSAELDQAYLMRLIDLFRQTSGQFFITLINHNVFQSVDDGNFKLFFVEDGVIYSESKN